MSLADSAIGLQHFLFDRLPRNVPEVLPKPRKPNPWLKDSKSIVSKINAGNDIRQSIDRALAALGPLTLAISRGDKVMVKANFNSEDPPPASTDLTFFRVMIEILLELGAKVTVGECSGVSWRPTLKTFNKLHLYELTRRLGVKLIAFDDKPNEWVRIAVNGEYLHHVVMPRSAYEADRLVYLPCLKTHKFARYSGALKLAFGFINPGEDLTFHLSHLEEKVAEISLCWQPDLIVMDARKAFISGGPDQGQVAEPKVILASGDLVAIDVEAVKVLLSYEARNKLLRDPWQLPQIIIASREKLGAAKNGYILIN
jgi:uncharacterized protein (DUF362 family)